MGDEISQAAPQIVYTPQVAKLPELPLKISADPKQYKVIPNLEELLKEVEETAH